MTRQRLLAICAFLAVVVISTNSPALGATSWAFNPSGSNARFGWSNGQHVTLPDGAAHGSPTVRETGFFFENAYGDMHFRAEAGTKPTVNAGVSVRVNIATATPPNPTPLPFITVSEYGTWGGSLADLAVTSDFDITAYPAGVNTGPISLPAVTFNPDHTWVTSYTFTPGPGNPLGAPWTDPTILSYFQIRVRNLIGAGSVPGTYIEKRGLLITTPEPGSILLLAAALPLVIRRRVR